MIKISEPTVVYLGTNRDLSYCNNGIKISMSSQCLLAGLYFELIYIFME